MPVVKKALDAGIVVVNIDNRFDPQVLQAKKIGVPFVGPTTARGARLVGEYLAKRLKAGDEVGIIEGVSTTTNAQQRTAGFRDAMDAAGMKIVSLQSGNWEIEKGQRGGFGDAQRASGPQGAARRQRQAWPSARYRRCARRAAPGR